MAYRQYFPALSVAEGGRPYSIAEFATDKGERAAAGQFSAPVAYPQDVELGQPRLRNRRGDIPEQEGWEQDRSSGVPLRGGAEYGSIPATQGTSFEESTEYRR